MKCTQPYIAQAEKFGRQILSSHSWGLSNPSLSQQIASKYSSFKWGRFPLATLTWLKQATHENTVSNTIQIFRDRVINVVPATNQLNVNLNFFGYGNAPMQKLGKNVLTLSRDNSIFTAIPSAPVMRVIEQWRSQLFMGTQLGSNTKLIQYLAKIHSYQFGSVVGQKNKNQEINNSIGLNSFNIEQNYVFNSTLWLSRKFLSLSSTGLTLAASTVQQPEANSTSVKENSDLKNPKFLAASSLGDSPMRLVVRSSNGEVGNFANKNSNEDWIPDVSTKLTQTQTSLLINAVTTNWNVSTFERKFNLWAKKDNLQPQPVLKAQKTALDSDNELKLTSRQIRTRRFNQLANELILRRQVNRTAADQPTQQQHYPFSQTTTMELAQSPPMTKSKPISNIQQSQRGIKKGWQQATPTNVDFPNIDVNGLADRVFQVIERKLKIERQRRGIL